MILSNPPTGASLTLCIRFLKMMMTSTIPSRTRRSTFLWVKVWRLRSASVRWLLITIYDRWFEGRSADAGWYSCSYPRQGPVDLCNATDIDSKDFLCCCAEGQAE